MPNAAFVLCRYPADPEDAREVIKRWYTKRACREDINTYLDLINYVFRDQDDHVTYAPHHWAQVLDKIRQLFAEAGFVRASSRGNSTRRWPTRGVSGPTCTSWRSAEDAI
ncbi:hypothetical protein [Streptomyces gardneri]|uniref:hypothetical protein n=1 Tax=Streptomyces gardneri TaxID=66892 RepID=UPI0033EC89CF